METEHAISVTSRQERRIRTREEQDALTMPLGQPWTQRTMPPEHVTALHDSHMCAGWDCSTCVWIATYEKLYKRLTDEQMAAGRLDIHLDQFHDCDGTEDGCPNA